MRIHKRVNVTYFYNSSTGGYANESPPALQYFTYETQLHLATGWHAYGSMQQMLAAIQKNHWPPPDSSKGLLGGSPAPAPGQPAISNAVSSNLGGLQAVGDFFNRLTEANTWIRVGEVVAGLLLLYLGVNALFKGTAAGNAVDSVKNTGKKVARVV